MSGVRNETTISGIRGATELGLDPPGIGEGFGTVYESLESAGVYLGQFIRPVHNNNKGEMSTPFETPSSSYRTSPGGSLVYRVKEGI